MTDKYLVALYGFPYFGPLRTQLLLKYFETSEKAWKADTKSLTKIGITKKHAEEFDEYRKNFNFEKFFDEIHGKKIKIITFKDSDYPKPLVGLNDAPLVLYIKGTLPKNFDYSVSIVGSRMMTGYGREVAEKISRELANYGFVIVSGLAFGIDVTSHKSALEHNGICVAVLASGVDEVTPRSHDYIAKNIIEKGGCIISEYLPGTKPQKYFFPYRNRIISGLSRITIVVEGKIKSGTIHTAVHAANQGKTVFAVPGEITSPNSQAPHFLIRNGARPLLSIPDILDELNLEENVQRKDYQPSDNFEKSILEILSDEEVHLDEIARITKLSIDEVLGKLTILEIKGIIKNKGDGIFKKI